MTHAVHIKENAMAPVQSAPAVTPIEERGYAHPEVLVSTDWVAQHLKIPRSGWSNPTRTCCSTTPATFRARSRSTGPTTSMIRVVRDYIDRERLQRLLRAKGINHDTTIVFYGDKNNWWATYALWVLQLFGLNNVKVMDGGRLRWIDEGRPLTTDQPKYREGNIKVGERDDTPDPGLPGGCAGPPEEEGAAGGCPEPGGVPRAKRPHMPEYPQEGCASRRPYPGRQEHSLGQGHRPGDPHVPSGRGAPEAVPGGQQAPANAETIAYCRIGERSSHTWFALTYLLGFDNVRNYDGSWTEWGNAVRLPVEKGEARS